MSRLVGWGQSSELKRKLSVAPIKAIQVRVRTICTLRNQLTDILSHRIGTDHQKIAKIDRENEVAPPPKISASVGKVQAFHVFSLYDF